MTTTPDTITELKKSLEAAQKREQVLRDELIRLRDVVFEFDREAIDAALEAK